jgi:hypothetical protein
MIAENDTPACISRPKLHADVSQTAIMKPANRTLSTQRHRRSQIMNLALPCQVVGVEEELVAFVGVVRIECLGDDPGFTHGHD